MDRPGARPPAPPRLPPRPTTARHVTAPAHPAGRSPARLTRPVSEAQPGRPGQPDRAERSEPHSGALDSPAKRSYPSQRPPARHAECGLFNRRSVALSQTHVIYATDSGERSSASVRIVPHQLTRSSVNGRRNCERGRCRIARPEHLQEFGAAVKGVRASERAAPGREHAFTEAAHPATTDSGARRTHGNPRRHGGADRYRANDPLRTPGLRIHRSGARLLRGCTKSSGP